MAAGKTFRCDTLTTSGISEAVDMRLDPTGNVIVTADKKLSCSTFISDADITFRPDGNNVVVGTGKTLKTNSIGTTDAGDLTLNPRLEMLLSSPVSS